MCELVGEIVKTWRQRERGGGAIEKRERGKRVRESERGKEGMRQASLLYTLK